MKNFLLLTMICFALGLAGSKPQSARQNPAGHAAAQSDAELQQVLTQLSGEFERISPRVIRPAEGFLKYPYLIPAGFYQQMWDWDGYFMGTWFIEKGKPEYMKYWALNFLEGMDENGYVAGCMTTEGPRVKRGTFFMKPFLSQGVLRASEAMGDFEWVRPWYDRLCRILAYRDATQRDEATGLYFWEMAFQSGADNNPALNYFADDTRSFLACDCSTMQMLEFQAQAKIAAALGLAEDAAAYEARAQALADAIRDILWCPINQCFYNVDRETGAHYHRISYSCFWPLYAGLASQEDGRAMIRHYLLDEAHLRSPHGLRSLSASPRPPTTSIPTPAGSSASSAGTSAPNLSSGPVSKNLLYPFFSTIICTEPSSNEL